MAAAVHETTDCCEGATKVGDIIDAEQDSGRQARQSQTSKEQGRQVTIKQSTSTTFFAFARDVFLPPTLARRDNNLTGMTKRQPCVCREHVTAPLACEGP